jgi:hypothetical protein
MPEPFGGDAVCDVAVSAAAAVHRDLTAGMTVCPTELAQVADGPPLALLRQAARDWDGKDPLRPVPAA